MTGGFTIYSNEKQIFHQELGSKCIISDYVNWIMEACENTGKYINPEIRGKLMCFIEKTNKMKRNMTWDSSIDSLLIVLIDMFKFLYNEKFVLVDTKKHSYWVERELINGIGKLKLPNTELSFGFS